MDLKILNIVSGDLWNNNKRYNICVIRVPREEKRVGGKKNTQKYKIPNLARGINLQIQEAD
jgi:hypothetical protein